MTYPFLGKTLSGPFTIPSGIVTTAPSIIQYFLNEVPQVGVITTKSIGLDARLGNREPVYSQYAPGCFVNAVGLTNPGAEVSADLLSRLTIPEDRFLMTSIFGGSVEEFVTVAQMLAPYSDGLELNLSCPHAAGYGMAMGQDPDLVYEIVSAVKAAVSIPVIPKLTPNTDNIAGIALAAERAGADGLCAINTLGPGQSSSFGHAVLSNGSGGLSGKGILPIALKCIREIRQVTELPIIGCGGASSARDVTAMLESGANIVGIGSALTGMTTQQIKTYFDALSLESSDQKNLAESHIQYQLDMDFWPVTLIANEPVCDDITLLTFAENINVKAGEFYFVWIPGIGEKPFSALTDDPFRLIAIDVGTFTHHLMDLEPGSEIYIRGPYGQPVAVEENNHVMAVAGGTGLAAVYQVARDAQRAEIFTGARTAQRLYFVDECKSIASVHVATDDGSSGYSGTVTELLNQRLSKMSPAEHANITFYNCGPEPMVHAAIEVQRRYCSDKQIFSAIDYLTKCGVGICGACATPDGQRLCVDGPFLAPLEPVIASD
ncbi:MAG: dihydroorotate dehydrogenase [Gammaproteobacteria bacterium]|nr:dihydroorotate dehydrogenase [Gammaproteobacteria bacterium]MBT5203592.1 dihydroorotate dehydrogenase [Gammaproteobacteria bacterium]MBT6243968.1 dihydroorotate dehydrogenase [Gammaproteobacteria bacterium]